MKKYNILVTGIGAIIGYGIINSLKKSRHDVNIVGMDIYDDAIGQEWCDSFEQSILAISADFPSFLKKIIQKHEIDLVIPGIEQDINAMLRGYDHFKRLKVKFALNKHELIRLFGDKWETYKFFHERSFKMIKTFIDGRFEDLKKELGLPFLMKPRRFYASKGIVKIECEEDYCYWQAKMGDNFMVQQIVGDPDNEFTVAVFGTGDGGYSDIIALKRKLGPDGATAKAKTVEEGALDEYIGGLCEASKPLGPTNIQVMRHEQEYLLLEINPRISSTTSIREAFGYNEAEMCIDYYLESKVPHRKKIVTGSAVRYIKDCIKYDSHNR